MEKDPHKLEANKNFSSKFVLERPQKKRPRIIVYDRPICLLPILNKLLEALILRSLNIVMEGKLSPSQYGFRTEKSAEEAIVEFRKIVENTSA